MIVSVDIGTSYSSISMLGQDGKSLPVDISTGIGYGDKYSMPTAVYVEDDGKILIGQAAVNNRMRNPQNFRMEFKRNFGDPNPMLIGKRSFLVEDLYAEILRHMKRCVQKLTEDKIEQAYLACPASYGKYQKDRLISVAKTAGLFNVKLIEEPVAAAMSYLEEGYIKDGQTILVYDFGGGTFDVALVKCVHGTFELLGEPAGLPRCGGTDMNRLVYQDMLQKIGTDTISEVQKNSANYLRFSNQLLDLAIKVKHQLSSGETAVEYIPVGWDSVEYRLERQSFEKMIAPMVGKTIQMCRELLENAGINISDLSAIVMVGGTSRVPLVKQMLVQLAQKIPVFQVPDLELAVVNGALKSREKVDGDAEQWYQKACELEEAGNDEAAFAYYLKSAELGYIEAQWNVGFFYEYGIDVAKNLTEAVKWYRKAADQGHDDAQFSLGACYENGDGVAKNQAEAVKWYRKAAEQGDAAAQFRLGVCFENGDGVAKNLTEAVKWYRKAAEQGMDDAQFRLGFFYEHGEGVTQNLSEAVRWYRKAAEQGYAAAQFRLGFFYGRGEGVTKNLSEAVRWYRKAAEQGYAAAQFSLGFCYEYGKGVAKNLSEAVKWFRKAAEQGYADAKRYLEDCYRKIVREVLAKYNCQNNTLPKSISNQISQTMDTEVYFAFFAFPFNDSIRYFAYTAKGIAWGSVFGEPNYLSYELLAKAKIGMQNSAIRLTHQGKTVDIPKFSGFMYNWEKIVEVLCEVWQRLQ